jgi:nitroimidazol reductase NimA-like FMN-containing flavoprotein (pyridoxamine 5'-phosphate oxidase superfamily)
MSTSYVKSALTKPSRMPERAVFDVEAVNKVIDEALVCHVSYTIEGVPHVLPTLHVRKDDNLYIHGSNGARLMLASGEPIPVSIAITLMDGIVFARSWFNHSINYRSVIVHGLASRVTDAGEKWDAMVALMNHVAPGRAEGSRDANKREFAATAILWIPLIDVSLKQRGGAPSVDDEDAVSPYWDGVVPVATVFGPAIPACDLPLPGYLAGYRRGD